jgi:hypothetical protein
MADCARCGSFLKTTPPRATGNTLTIDAIPSSMRGCAIPFVSGTSRTMACSHPPSLSRKPPKRTAMKYVPIMKTGLLAPATRFAGVNPVWAAQPPNIVLFFVDDLGWNTLVYRNPGLFEENLQRRKET